MQNKETATQPDHRSCLLLVDDEPANLKVLRHTLQDSFRLLFAKDGASALALLEKSTPDLILLDIMMPEMSGYEVCQALKSNKATQSIPVIFITALNEVANERKGLEMGAVDYIVKPFNPSIVKARVNTHLQLVRVDELKETRQLIIHSLGKAAEYRDNETGQHVIRIGYYSRHLARTLGLSEEFADNLLHAAPMHDVGKIGIPDKVLLKPGPLNEEEWRVMKQHPDIGAHILGKDHRSPLLQMATAIAQNHHEKWDGSGYPAGRSGEDIPLEARIVSLVDVFDALLSKRPYKEPWPLEDVLALIKREKGRHFDPELVDAFLTVIPEMLEIRAHWADE